MKEEEEQKETTTERRKRKLIGNILMPGNGRGKKGKSKSGNWERE